MSRTPNGLTIYQGPSIIDRGPIVSVVTGTRTPSTNAKTGAMLQMTTLRQDLHPVEASRCGADKSICGGCKFRRDPKTGRRACYVPLIHGPAASWNAWRAGRYPADLAQLDRSRVRCLRLGAYGDPAAVPQKAVEEMVARLDPFVTVGYTARWNTRRAQWLKRWAMASAKTHAEAAKAHAMGWRVFQTVSSREAAPKGPGWVECRHSAEGIPCVACGLCSGRVWGAGDVGPSVWNVAHGNGVNRALAIVD